MGSVKLNASADAPIARQVVKKAQTGAGAAIKIEHAVYQSSKAYGRQ